MSLREIREGWFNYMKYKLSKRLIEQEFKEIIESRASVCAQCPDLKIASDRLNSIFQGKCGVCGCSFPAIIYSKSKKCPDGRWDAIPTELTAASDNK